jgi:site-specific DNA recombinase
MINPANMRYIIYGRKSTDDKNRQVRSIPDQLAEMRAVANHCQAQIVDVMSESQTAKEPGRPVFNDMLRRIEAGEADGIMAWHPDRLARNWIDGGRILDLIDRGIIKDLKFATCYFEPTASGKMNLANQFCQSKYYVDNLSDNVKRTFNRMIAEGLWPEKAPIGYRNAGKGKVLTTDQARAQFIIKMYELYVSGSYGFAQIRDLVTHIGLRTDKGNPISISKVQFILRNPFYHGIMRWKGGLHPGKHPTLVTKDLFDRVQIAMQRRGRPRHHKKLKNYLYRALFACQCGCTITTETQKGHNYLRCTRKKTLCRQPFVREEQVSEQIAQAVGRLTLLPNTADWLIAELEREQREHLTSFEAEIDRIRSEIARKLNHISRLIDGYTRGDLTGDEFRDAKSKIVQEKKVLEEKAVLMEKNRTGWLEPAIRFVKASKQANIWLDERNLTKQRDFFRKAGSNRKITNKLVTWEPTGAWKTLVNAGRLAHHPGAASCDAAPDSGEPDQHVSKLEDLDSNAMFFRKRHAF